MGVDIKTYDGLIMVTPTDFQRVESQYKRLIANLPVEKLYFVGSSAVGELVQAAGLGETVGFINENDILSFDAVHAVMKEALKDIYKEELPRGITGWYYQQFLKMEYARCCQNEYYLVWDGDTVPCGPFSMFSESSGEPFLGMKTEYHEEYFVTIGKLFPGMHKIIQKSFIAEHMLMRCDIMKHLMEDIEAREDIRGTAFWEKIIWSIAPEKLTSNSFSEFETYGTYVAFKYLGAYRLRDWHSFRYAGMFYEIEKITDADYAWLAKDFFAASFEKQHYVRDDHRNLFDNPEYQSKLSARQMLEIAQEEFSDDSYIETW